MIYSKYADIVSHKKPGDTVYAVRIDAYKAAAPELWKDITPVRGTLQSSYFDQPKSGPYPPRHLLPEAPDPENAWDGPWWDLEHWIVCDTEDEARDELKKQAAARIARAQEELSMMKSVAAAL